MEPFIGQIKMFGGNFAPRSYALCNGQVLSIAQNTALFSLLGTTYGGNGQTTFALPDLRGRVPIHQGQGPGLSNRIMGEFGGTESETLTLPQLPAHSHNQSGGSTPASDLPATETDPAGHVFAVTTDGSSAYAATSNAALAGSTSGSTGGNQPHTNLQPYLCVNFIIALQGIFPSRN